MLWCCSECCLVMHSMLHNPCKWVVCKVGCNDPVTAANYAATKVDTMDRKLQCDIMTSSLPRDRAASVLMWLANTSKSVPFLQTFHRSDRYEHSYRQKRQRTGRHILQNDIFGNTVPDWAVDVSMMEGRPWIFGGCVPDQVLLLLVWWQQRSYLDPDTELQPQYQGHGRDLDIFLLQFFML